MSSPTPILEPQGFVCKLEEGKNPGYDAPLPDENQIFPGDVRSLALSAYDIGKFVYAWCPPVHWTRRKWPSPIYWVKELGVCCWYEHLHPSRRKRTRMNIDEMVTKWKVVVVGLATAHDKDEADRFEASVDSLLTPLLAAPVAQIREFSRKLLAELKADKAVPLLVWMAYEIYVEEMEKAPDADVKELKQDLAKQIVDLVEQDAKEQLPEAMVRALMWRSPQRLQEVKAVVEKEKSAGHKTRLRGRESCLFLEAGGTEEVPAICIQI